MDWILETIRDLQKFPAICFLMESIIGCTHWKLLVHKEMHQFIHIILNIFNNGNYMHK